jgi:hypothetical protein
MEIVISMVAVWGIYTLIMMILRVLGQIGRSLSLAILKLTRFGVYFHELCHFAIAKMLGFRVTLDQISIHGSSGSVHVRAFHPHGLTLGQAVYLALAPLALGTLILIELWGVTKNFWGEWSLVITLGIAMLTLILVVPPSFRDIKNVFAAIYYRPGIAVLHVVEGGVVYFFLPVLIALFGNVLGILPPMVQELLIFTLIFGIIELGRVGIGSVFLFCCQKLGVVTTKSEPFRVKTAPHITMDYLLDPTPTILDFVGEISPSKPT